jgi:protoporphyrinogen oxidase
MSTITIVGAGVAGLTIASRLARAGRAVTVIEQGPVVGGLARSYQYGPFGFDIGPHRFHTDNPAIAAFIRDTLREEILEIPRRSGVRMFGRFHDWPLRPSVFLSMPFGVMLRGAKDLVFRERLPGESFEADAVNKYGRTLYGIFFGPYTEKFLFYSPAALHRDWARAGVDRAVIDKRARVDSLWNLLRTTLLPKPVDTTFLYPRTGIGRFAERLAEEIAAAGGRVMLGQPVTALRASGSRVAAVEVGGEWIACENLVWTGPLDLLNRLLGIGGIDLEYLSTILYNLEIGRPAKLDYQWTYYGGDELFCRVSIPATFAPGMAPAGKSGLCVELTCREGDERWRHPERHVAAIVRDLVRTRTIDRESDVEQVHIERVPCTYPIYKLNYQGELGRNLQALAAFRNLLPAGRCGRFWYNNMDHSIGQGLAMADRILGGEPLSEIDTGDREFWASGPAADRAPRQA